MIIQKEISESRRDDILLKDVINFNGKNRKIYLSREFLNILNKDGQFLKIEKMIEISSHQFNLKSKDSRVLEVFNNKNPEKSVFSMVFENYQKCFFFYKTISNLKNKDLKEESENNGEKNHKLYLISREDTNYQTNNKALESFESLDKSNEPPISFTRNVFDNKDTMDLTFRDIFINPEIVVDDSSKSTYVRLKKILTESFEVEEDINDIPSRKINKIPSFRTKKFFIQHEISPQKDINLSEINDFGKHLAVQFSHSDFIDPVSQLFQHFNHSNHMYTIISSDIKNKSQQDSLDTKNHYFEWISLMMSNSYTRNNLNSLIFKEIEYTICPSKLKKIMKLFYKKNKGKKCLKDTIIQMQLYIIYYFGNYSITVENVIVDFFKDKNPGFNDYEQNEEYAKIFLNDFSLIISDFGISQMDNRYLNEFLNSKKAFQEYKQISALISQIHFVNNFLCQFIK